MFFENGALSSSEKKRLNRLNWDIKPCFLVLPNAQFRFFIGKWHFLKSQWDFKRALKLHCFQSIPMSHYGKRGEV